MLTAAVTALARTDDTAGVVLVGGAVTLLAWTLTPLWLGGVLFVSPAVAVAAPVALAPSLVARGYFVRVTRAGIQAGDPAGAPSLVAWGELVRDGLKSAVLSAALLAPLVAGLAVAGLAAAALVAGPVDPASTAAAVESALGPNGPIAVAAVAVALVAALVGAYLLAFAYVRPAALAAFAASGRVRDGLNPRTVVGVAATGRYATGWTLAAGALAVGYALAAPTAPIVVGVAFAFLARVVAHGLYGRGAAGALTGGTPLADARSAPRATRGATVTHGAGAARSAAIGDVSSTPQTGPAGDGSSVPAVSGDGGRPIRSEPPAAVQVGRVVPIEAGDSIDPTDPPEATDDPVGGFEWGPPLSEAEDKG
ncbi:DUF4013 domain-containing protein [Halorubrum sp. GN11_10-6_MGM]|uniref:DUF4013 domain-containing protein n=1 Tax=Halorubrum sp. GN11_10-6_MGM TaxID=2518112 RepID=UPI0010F56D99|nr:DUF4013 domain-containing protein [Halorubrum sp. GN11_10-6_MGM]TKX74171.1 DUF4013 domain-containing protein [Halorubrum sp. GN11_10-6_MGM]